MNGTGHETTALSYGLLMSLSPLNDSLDGVDTNGVDFPWFQILNQGNVTTEISSLTTEYDTVKNTLSKNIEKSFKRYNA